MQQTPPSTPADVNILAALASNIEWNHDNLLFISGRYPLSDVASVDATDKTKHKQILDAIAAVIARHPNDVFAVGMQLLPAATGPGGELCLMLPAIMTITTLPTSSSATSTPCGPS
jgi:hypothetical protein